MIARMIGRYTIFQNIYLQRTSVASKELKEALIRLYAARILYLSKAKSFFEQTSVKRMLKSAVLSQDEFANLSQSIMNEEHNVDRYAALVDAENRTNISAALEALSINQNEKYAGLRGLLYTIDGPILRMSSQVDSFEDYLDKSKRVDILRWVSSQPYSEHHEQVFKHALPGTGKWLIEDPIYERWHKGSTSSLLWLHGKVGSGKSTLM